MLRSEEETEYQSLAECRAGLTGVYAFDKNPNPNEGLATRETPEFIGEKTQILPLGTKPDESKIIKVRSNLKPLPADKDNHVSFPVAIFEKSEAHPNGELYIADGEIHEAAYTARVIEKLIDGEIIAVTQS